MSRRSRCSSGMEEARARPSCDAFARRSLALDDVPPPVRADMADSAADPRRLGGGNVSDGPETLVSSSDMDSLRPLPRGGGAPFFAAPSSGTGGSDFGFGPSMRNESRSKSPSPLDALGAAVSLAGAGGAGASA